MRSTAILATAFVVAGACSAAAGPQFSADAVQTQPGQEMRYGKLYVGDKGTRFEYQQGGQPVVQIARSDTGKTITLFPLLHSYAETASSADMGNGEFRPDVACKSSADVECKKESDAAQGSTTIERWTMTPKNGVPVQIWWDAKRKMAVREEYADGRVMQATLRMTMPFNGQQVENWEILYMSPNGMFRRGMSLYAPSLGFSVLEQQPGGVMRELRNVQIGSPDAKLFDVPEGYKQIEPSKVDNAESKTPSAAGTPPQAGQSQQGAQAPNGGPTMMQPGQQGAAMPGQMMMPPNMPREGQAQQGANAMQGPMMQHGQQGAMPSPMMMHPGQQGTMPGGMMMSPMMPPQASQTPAQPASPMQQAPSTAPAPNASSSSQPQVTRPAPPPQAGYYAPSGPYGGMAMPPPPFGSYGPQTQPVEAPKSADGPRQGKTP
jgi:hypothetical protein